MLTKYETAKLAKEKGFNEVCTCGWDYEKEEAFQFPYWVLTENPTSPIYEGTARNNEIQDDILTNYYVDTTIPTQSELQKWLREKCNLIVTPLHEGDDKWSVNVEHKVFSSEDNLHYESHFHNLFYNSFEEALEEGLVYALNYME